MPAMLRDGEEVMGYTKRELKKLSKEQEKISRFMHPDYDRHCELRDLIRKERKMTLVILVVALAFVVTCGIVAAACLYTRF